ncbi:baseplate J/gp47 family protein [Candidatus Thiothrix sp. Deng01]|uniref:Baseplate J/gp47 family protein n=1 Tax=Candidatus Thiothrix phosphatis TaxID=3112415 RepID=A0ABU6D542_9GAMM|nr:baseplate J/gp47 family protein [Candidatus Thiothrix sp. Deng01]MEB4593418.1 baseplate J/gp47 family protein [Candidatus Thiothrix sp. Deng01]
MADPLVCDNRLRDGVSQQMRVKAALQPDSVAVDERSLQDWLGFLRDYSRELRYFAENDQADGDWQAFFPADITPDEMLAFIRNPDALPEAKAQACRQPHLVLLFSFLQLLDATTQRLNTLTRRHLEFYFRHFLRLQEKPAQPDHVHVLVELARQQGALLLPAGSLLHAGKDSAGKPLAYQTDADALISQAQIARLSALYADKRLVSLQAAREALLEAHGDSPASQQEAFLLLLRMTYGQPAVGDALPPYPSPTAIGARTPDFPLLASLFQQLAFVHDRLRLPFVRFDELMQLKQRREPESGSASAAQFAADWGLINRTLERAGQLQRQDDAYTLPTRDGNGNAIRVDDFQAHFMAALGLDPYAKTSFLGLPDIATLDELYQHRNEPLAQEFLQTRLKPLLDVGATSFEAMMQTKTRIDGEWAYLDELLATASGKKPKFTPLPDFSRKLRETLRLNAANLANGIGSIDALYASLQAMQGYFYLSAYALYSVLNTAFNPQADAAAWSRAYATLATAYKARIFQQRQQQLQQLISPAADSNAILASMLALALGDPSPHTLNDLGSFMTHADLAYLTDLQAQAAVSAAEWDKATHMLAIAWRNRECRDPTAEQEEWRGLYAAEDVTAVLSPQPADATGTTARWKTFGQPPAASLPRPLAEFGLAISSPMLLLNQGERTLTLTLELAAQTPPPLLPDGLDGLFQVLGSTPAGWVAAKVQTLTAGAGNLNFTLQFGAEQEALAAPTTGLLQGAPWPVLKLLFQNDGPDGHSRHYPALQPLLLAAIRLSVTVDGLSELQIRNDLQALDSHKPFEPFGPRPTAGARFYVAAPELAVKPLSRLTFHTEWANLDLLTDDYYRNYPGNLKRESFTIRIGARDVSPTAATLFADQPITLKQALAQPETVYWELQSPDFQHAAYPALATRKAVELATAIANKRAADTIDANNYRVNPPYTPVIKSLTLDYAADLPVITLKDYPGNAGATKIFHLHPFGYAEIQPDATTGLCALLPQFKQAGELYIGLAQCHPPQQLNLLFQLAEGSADADLTPQTVHWDYLSGNRWQPLENGNILSDGTRGLINSGVMQVSLPACAPNTLLTPELYWLRASIGQAANSVCDTIAIHTQAVAATLIDNGNAPDHWQQPLASGTITRLVTPLAGVKAIRQPYTAFGGHSAEQEASFHTRVSERLRHKQRALTRWDYEHLTLEHFPQIYKAKCVPAALLQTDAPPGAVTVVVIPDIRNRLPANPFEPKAPADLLADIQSYLQSLAPEAATVMVRNARYVPFRIRMGVRFLPGHDVGYSRKLLNEALNRFLAPWAYQEGADIVIGGKIYANSIINFVERLPYIDYIAQLNFFGAGVSIDSSGDSISANQQADVLVPEPEHVFDLIPESGYEQASFHGINHMRIGLDFIVG